MTEYSTQKITIDLFLENAKFKPTIQQDKAIKYSDSSYSLSTSTSILRKPLATIPMTGILPTKRMMDKFNSKNKSNKGYK